MIFTFYLIFIFFVEFFVYFSLIFIFYLYFLRFFVSLVSYNTNKLSFNLDFEEKAPKKLKKNDGTSSPLNHSKKVNIDVKNILNNPLNLKDNKENQLSFNSFPHKIKRELLVSAIQSNDVVKVRSILKSNVKIDSIIKGKTPLIYAIYENHYDLVKLLIGAKACLNRRDKEGCFPLIHAIQKNNYEIVELLIKHGAKLNVEDNDGFSPLFHAIKTDCIKLIKLLLENGADVNSVNLKNQTVLMEAVCHQNIEIVELLLDSGAQIEHHSFAGWTPLLCAIFHKNFEMVTCLLKRKANVNCMGKEFTSLPLILAKRIKDKRILKLLLDYGADPTCFQISHKKSLAQIWGIKGESVWIDKNGKSTSFQLEGYSKEFGSRLFEKYLPVFFKGLSDVRIDIIIEAFKQKAPAELSEKIKNGEPVVLDGGTFDHTVAFVIYKNILVICNRGLRSKGESGAYFYRFNREMTHEDIENLTKVQKNIQEFDQMLIDLDLDLDFYKHVGYKEQKVGNCTWASWKVAFGVLCHLLNMSENKQLYKHFTAFARELSLQKYLKRYPSLDDDLVRMVLDKKRKKNLRFEGPVGI